MKAARYAALFLLVIFHLDSDKSKAQQQVIVKQDGKDSTQFSILVVEAWGAEDGPPGISFSNQSGISGKILLQHADAVDPDVAVVNHDKSKYAIVAYFSPKDSAYYAEFFEWNGNYLSSLGVPLSLMNRVNNNSILNVRSNVNGEFVFELDGGSADKNLSVEGWIDPVTGQPTLRTTPKVYYRITENNE